MNFSEALFYLKSGRKIYRKGWDSPNKLFMLNLQVPDENSKMTKPYIYMQEYLCDVKQINRYPWIPSHEDLLADDWLLTYASPVPMGRGYYSFKQAFSLLKQGKFIKLPQWSGYWEWDCEKQTIMMYTKEGKVLDIRSTDKVEYTLNNIMSNKWVVADSSNCPLLGGIIRLDKEDAERYQSKGIEVVQLNINEWTFKGGCI